MSDWKYQERLKRFEAEKKKLQLKGLSPKEYKEAVKHLAKMLRI